MSTKTILKLTRCHIFICVVVIIGVSTIVGVATYYGTVNAQTEDPVSANTDKITDADQDFIPGTEPWLNLHLPSYTVPLHYDLILYPDFYGDHDRFYGNVTIHIQVKQTTYFLLVHYNKLEIKAKSIKDTKDNSYGVKETFKHEPNQFFVVRSEKLINESTTVKLELQFEGSLSDGIVGFYKAFYDNKTKAMATSKFEPVDARKAFPCFDEPNLKATYTTTLIHAPDYVPLSNMPVKTEVDAPYHPGLKSTTFEKSVPMSTYLACFIVCDCEYDERILKSGKKFRVYSVKGRKEQVEYSLKFGAKVTDFFEEYFSLDYPLPKMDMIAIPDFVSGAMEHWGLITYRETNLLYKEGVSSPSNKQRIAEVVAHELAHQWFGNIVTMDWWDDLWLNEGFATFMSYVGTDPFEPEFEVFTQFPALEAYGVMDMDSKSTSHPIIVPVNRPEEITAVFDAISYNKGASVIGMLEAFVGNETFKEGLKEYLSRYQYDNAKTYQLWESIGAVADMDINIIMDTWTKQSGFPVITVTIDRLTNKVKVEQEIFKAQKSATLSDWPLSDYGYKWEVPLRFVSSLANNRTFDGPQIHYNQSSLEFDPQVNISASDVWLKLNPGTTGYYKVNYPKLEWNRFYQILNTSLEIIDPADRAGLVYDALTLAGAGYLDYQTALDLVKYMEKEEHYVPWRSVSSELFYIRNMMDNQAWKEYVRGLVRPVYNKLGWEESGTHLDKLLRGTVIRLACGHNSTDCIREAKRQFDGWLVNNTEIDSGVRRDMFTYGMTDVNEQQWDQVWDKYITEGLASTKVDIIRGLARNSNTTIITKLLSHAMDKDKIADQDFFTVISLVSSNPAAKDLIWTWVQDNYQMIEDRFSTQNRYFGRMVPGIVDGFSTSDELIEVEAFFNKYPNAGAGKVPREQALESIRTNMKWKEGNAFEVCTFLDVEDCSMYPNPAQAA